MDAPIAPTKGDMLAFEIQRVKPKGHTAQPYREVEGTLRPAFS